MDNAVNRVRCPSRKAARHFNNTLTDIIPKSVEFLPSSVCECGTGFVNSFQASWVLGVRRFVQEW